MCDPLGGALTSHHDPGEQVTISPDSAHRVRRIAWVLGIVAGCLALVIVLIGYVTRGELRLELLAAGFALIVFGLLMRPSRPA